MNELHTIRRQVMLLAVGILITLLIMWFLTPPNFKPIVAGAVLGISVGLYNILHLARRLRISGEQAIATNGKRISGLGVINRYLMVTLAAIIIATNPQYFDPKGFAMGLPVCYILPLAVAIFQKKKQETKGVKDKDGNHSKA
ncbi:ATP synthase subunit I [Thermoflavimicrobium dichotomicum]|uniref:ATP synthase I chain n=1 Tax=Thermoflavimicrobium dichotomicum TaxID=46223 RepID=A0A1I3K2J7_9BACL|nr:ATP synthase subunit I [Thermoflavimicrobium dichotomicum]SFI66656.1 ATP synthase I chain [Thermoflavimicrobium dichotomicum]